MKRISLLVVSALLLALGSVVLPVGAAQATTTTFTTIGASTYSVPSGVTKVRVVATGGGGGAWGTGPGGSGCTVTADVTVTPLATIDVGVGGGGSGTGFGGGAAGGGGGSSYFNLDGTANMVIAGGGGGQGFDTSQQPGDACHGGIAAGGAAGTDSGSNIYGGAGGAGGIGGAGGNNGAGTVGGDGGTGLVSTAYNGGLGTTSGTPAGNGGASGAGAGGDNCTQFDTPPLCKTAAPAGERGGVGGSGGGLGGHTGTAGRAGGGAGWGGGGGGANNGSGGAGGSAPTTGASYSVANNGGSGTISGGGGTGGNGSVSVTPLNQVTYSANGGSGTAPTDTNFYAQDDSVTAANPIPPLTRTGFTFAGWNTASDGSGTSYPVGGTFPMPATALTLYAQWTAISYVLSYSGNGATSGSVPVSSSLASGAFVLVAGNTGPLVRTGYTFSSWNTQADGLGTTYAPGSTYTGGLSSTVLYALWTANSNALTYAAPTATGGSVPAGSTPATGSTVTAATNSGSLVRTDYTFAGWNTASDGSGTTYPVGATFTMPPNALTLYANWTANSLSFSYDGNGATSGSVPAGSALAPGGTAVVASNSGPLVRDGYTFSKWNTQADGLGTDYSPGATFTGGSNPTVLYAVWTANSNALTYAAPTATGGSVPAASTPATDSTVTASTNSGSLVRTGYTFTGWNTASDGSGTTYPVGATFTMPPNALTLYANWTATSPTYAVSYDANSATGGTVPSGSSYSPGATATAATNSGSLVRTGYTFGGWNTQADGGGTTYAVSATFTMPSNDVTLYANWNAVSTPKADQTQGALSHPVRIKRHGTTVLNTRKALTRQRLPMTAHIQALQIRGDLRCFSIARTSPRGLAIRTFGACSFTLRVTYAAPGNATYAAYSKTYTYQVHA